MKTILATWGGVYDAILLTLISFLTVATIIFRDRRLVRIMTIVILLGSIWVGVASLVMFGPRWAAAEAGRRL